MENSTAVIQELNRRIAELEHENQELRDLLKKHGVCPPQKSQENVAIEIAELTPSHIKFMYARFHGRKDVYSRRTVTKDGRGVYYPVCNHFWEDGICPKRVGKKVRCMDCNAREWTPLNQRALLAHLRGESENGTDVVGIYPLMPDETCHFLVFDFDHHDMDESENDLVSWKEEVNAMREICRTLGVPCLVERSRSGNGAHVWIFFDQFVPAVQARQFGTCLLTKGADYVSQKSFVSYDRMLPAQDHMPKGGLGNLIALPLQGKALRNGNSAFIDEDWNPYPNQWTALAQAECVSKEFLMEKIKCWSFEGCLGPLSEQESDIQAEEKPWKSSSHFELKAEDVENELKIVRANQIYIDTSNLKPRLQNQLRRLASFQNPNYYKTLAMGYSVRKIPRIIPCFREENEYLALPRGKWEELEQLLAAAKISLKIIDERQKGHHINAVFCGLLYPEQMRAAEMISKYETGILSAATAFGKTAVGSWLIAHWHTNTLILVHNREIMKNWVEDLSKFLTIQEECPEYITPAGRHKRRSSVIGTRYAGHDSMTGIIDVAMVSSLGKTGEIDPIIKEYGMVLMDECHHGAAQTAEDVLREITAQYVYGLTATPKRDDGLEQKVTMQFGGIRYRFTAKEKAALQGIRHVIVPRFTRLVNLGEKWNINQAYQKAILDQGRNKQISEDVLHCIESGRTPLVLTKFKEHAALLQSMLADSVQNIFLLQGGRSSKERDSIRAAMQHVPKENPMVVIAIGKYIGEGFNCPRLDTLILASPIAWEGNVEQYAGRLHRDYEGKTETVIFDYVDWHVPVFEKMYHKRIRAYRKIGYEISTQKDSLTNQISQIYDGNDCISVFLEDVRMSRDEIFISSPYLGLRSTRKFLDSCAICQQNGVRITVATHQAENAPDAVQKTAKAAQELLRSVGISIKEHSNLYEHCAVIDHSIVWYGNINLLSNVKQDDNMMRVVNRELAEDLYLLMATKSKD